MSDRAGIPIPVSPGELIDKITILEIKSARFGDGSAIQNVHRELALLSVVRDERIPGSADLAEVVAELKSVNERLWEIEDRLRDSERRQDFGPAFIELARSVYLNNDQRSVLKKRINLMLGSEIVEEKQYAVY